MLNRNDRFYTGGFLALLFVVNLLNYIDRLIITGLLDPIRRDLGATDAQMGLVGLAFTLTYALLPPIFGWLGDRWPRTGVIAGSATLWSVATALTGLSRNVGQLAAMRGVVGTGEASYMANAPGLIADLFPAKWRGRAMSFFYTASPIGAALGVMLAGVLGSAFGWRVACLVVGIPGLFAALLVWRFDEPLRGRFDRDVVVERPSLRETAKLLIRNRVFVFITLGLAGQIFLQNAVEFWLPTVLQRDKAFPILEANAIYGTASLVAGITGPMLGVFLADLLRRKVAGAYYWVCSGTMLLLIAPLFGLAASSTRTPILVSTFLEILLANIPTGLVIALAVSAVAPGIRSTAMAVLLTVGHLLGDAISQPLVGSLSTNMQQGGLSSGVMDALAALLRANPEHHLTVSLLVVALPAAVVSALLYRAAMPRADAERAQRPPGPDNESREAE